MTHTPGPWKVETDEKGDNWIRIPHGHDLCFGNMEDTGGCCFANAALIAAAPELLEALIRAKKMLGPHSLNADAMGYAMIEAAIEKAGG